MCGYCAVIVLVALVGLNGCNSEDEYWRKYDKVHLSARQALPYAVSMEEKYPECDHYIIQYGSKEASNEWQTRVFFGGRYMLTMTCEVVVDYEQCSITPIGDPEFRLKEIRSISVAERRTRLSGEYEFGVDEFRKLQESDWDFSVIDVRINSTEVNDFDWFRKKQSGGRRKIVLREDVVAPKSGQ